MIIHVNGLTLVLETLEEMTAVKNAIASSTDPIVKPIWQRLVDAGA